MLNPLRVAVLLRASEGPMFAGSGYGPLFEEMMLAERDGHLAVVDRGGATYLAITEKGAAAQKENDHGSE